MHTMMGAQEQQDKAMMAAMVMVVLMGIRLVVVVVQGLLEKQEQVASTEQLHQLVEVLEE